VAQHGSDRGGDVARGECRGRDLVQQRLEQVVVVLVDQRDVDRRAVQRPRSAQSPEAAADDDDARVT
jgi:hypothetical protein